MDPMFLPYQNPYVAASRSIDGFMPNLNGSAIFNKITTEDDLKVPMNITNSFPSNFSPVALNIVSPQQKDVPIIPNNYYQTIPFAANSVNKEEHAVKHDFSLSTYNVPLLDSNGCSLAKPFSLSYRRNLFPPENSSVDNCENKDPSTFIDLGSPPEFVPRGQKLTPAADLLGRTSSTIISPTPFLPPITNSKDSSVLKYKDLSVVPEFIPKSAKKNIQQNETVIIPPVISSNSLTSSNLSAALNTAISTTEQDQISSVATFQENVNGTVYFFTASPPVESSPNLANVSTTCSSSPGLYSDPVVTKFDTPVELQFKQLSISIADPNSVPVPYYSLVGQGIMDPTSAGFQLPEKVENYCNLVQLEPLPRPSYSMPPYITTVYKAIHVKSGTSYCLRRIHDVSLPSAKCVTLANTWKKLSHTNLVHLHDMFATTEFGDNSLVFVYDFYENCESVLSKHFASQRECLNGYTDTFSSDPNAPRPYSHTKNALLRQQHSNVMLPESTLWSYAIQLTGALRVIHSAGLSCRCIDPTKIILMGNSSRLRISGLGINDIVMYNHSLTNRNSMTSHFQQDDLTQLGKLLLAMSCGSLIAIQRENMQTSLDVMSRSYSKDIRNLIAYLLSTNQKRNVVDLMPMIGARFYSQIDAMQLQCDLLQSEVMKEMSNKNLLKLLIKLNLILDYSDPGSDNNEQTVNDKYSLSLFRDYLYEQVTDDQRPWVNVSHVTSSLGKFGNASSEKVCLVPKNDTPVIIMSYEEIKGCFDRLFDQFTYYGLYTDEDVAPVSS